MRRIVPLWVLLLAVYFQPTPAQAFLKKPKLIVLVVVDQFRADYLTRFQGRFLPAAKKDGDVGGFKYLMSRGAYFPYGHHDLLQNMTGPGHSVIATGSFPYQSGLALNYWYDHQTEKTVYCTEDDRQALVGAPNREHAGASPRNLSGTTIGDEIKNAGYPAHVVSVAYKDRAAILMGGHRADLAFWFDPDAFQWASSTFYLPDKKLPRWMEDLNTELLPRRGQEVVWEAPGGAVGFKHAASLGSKDSGAMPFGTEITEKAAEKAIEAFRLGSGPGPDFLAVGFSNHDYVGHKYGPNSREIEEMTVVEDLLLSRLLNYIRKHVPGGLANVTIALSADHGIPPDPEMIASRIESGRIDEKDYGRKLAAALEDKFGKPDHGSWVPFTVDFNFWLNQAEISRRKLDRGMVEAEARSFLLTLPGVQHVITATDVAKRHLPPGQNERQILHSYYPGRTGDLVLIPRPFFMKNEDHVDHLTGYGYDTTVPIIIAGFGAKPGVYPDKAEVVDIAPTLTYLAGALPPALSEGRVLSEALAPEKAE